MAMANVTAQASAGILGVVALLWGASGMAGERAVMVPTPSQAAATMDALDALEGDAAQHRDDPREVASLAQAYLDARAPGLALRVVESAPVAVRTAPAVAHLHAVALFDMGRAHEAQLAEREVLARCAPMPGVDACDARLVASASRRLDYLEEMIALGVEDPAAHPEASQVAYRSSTREIRLAVASR
jgi:hypothetical protein